MTRSRLLIVLLLTALAVAAAGCGDDDDSSDDASTAPTETQTQTQTAPQETATGTVEAKKVKPSVGEADPDTKPKVPKGKGSPPTELEVQDLIVGKGARVKAGDRAQVQYVGVLFKNGEEFDASWQGRKPGQPFPFTVGAGGVIPGWEQGVPGMREGGRRKLIIPAKLAYGAHGYPPSIPPNSALIFDIDLEKTGS